MLPWRQKGSKFAPSDPGQVPFGGIVFGNSTHLPVQGGRATPPKSLILRRMLASSTSSEEADVPKTAENVPKSAGKTAR